MLASSVRGFANRPDLRRVRPAASSMRPGGNVASLPEPGRGSTAGRLGLTGNVELDTGTISVGMIGLIVIGTVAFYYWTRGSQR